MQDGIIQRNNACQIQSKQNVTKNPKTDDFRNEKNSNTLDSMSQFFQIWLGDTSA